MRRHPLSGAELAASAETAIITSLITETRDFLADEIRVAVKAALQAQAAVPVGVSFTGDLEISGLSASPDISN
jgi:shikimate kinase